MAASEATLIAIEARPGEARAEPEESKKATRRTADSSRRHSSSQRLVGDLRQFVSEHPQGWGHSEWLDLLDRLGSRGHDTADADGIGRLLERERLTVSLERVRGLGPQRVRTLVDRYQTLWALRQADAGELAKTARLGRPLAERVREAVG